VQAFNALLLPKASHAVQRGLHDVRQIVLGSSLAIGLAFLAFPVLLGWFAGPIMELLFAGRYSPSGWLVLMLALRTYLVMTAVPLTVGLIVCRQACAVFKSEVVSLVLTALLGLPLTWVFGVWGVAWGFLLTRFFSRVYLALAFRRYLKSALRLAPAAALADPAAGLAVVPGVVL